MTQEARQAAKLAEEQLARAHAAREAAKRAEREAKEIEMAAAAAMLAAKEAEEEAAEEAAARIAEAERIAAQAQAAEDALNAEKEAAQEANGAAEVAEEATSEKPKGKVCIRCNEGISKDQKKIKLDWGWLHKRYTPVRVAMSLCSLPLQLLQVRRVQRSASKGHLCV